MKIEKATLDDIFQIYEIELTNYGKDEATELETFADIVNFPDDFIGYSLFVARSESVVGFYCTIEEEGSVDLVDIAVDISFQNTGVGRKLLVHCLQENKGKLIHLIVREDNLPAIKLYESSGFQKMKILKDYYEDCIGIRYEKAVR